jgi:hypothetical protein
MTAPDRPVLRRAGWFLCVAVLVCNHWLLARLFSPDGTLGLSTKLSIWLMQISGIILGVALIRFSRSGLGGWELVRKSYTSLAIMLLNTALLFVAANIAAALFHQVPSVPEVNYVSAMEMRVLRPAVLRELYRGRTDDEIRELLQPPNITAHPTLEFMEHPVASRFYNVGLENMRYNRFVHAGNAQAKINGAVWVLGGSTTFGHGVADDETIAAYLNELDPSSVYVNFGTQAYHQSLEIDKVLLLLKKGYRPSRVIFIDGLNDIVSMTATNFRPAEHPVRLYDAYGYRSNIESVRSPENEFVFRKLPLFDLVFAARERFRAESLPDTVFDRDDDLDDPEALYHNDPLLHYELVSRRADDYAGAVGQISRYQKKLLSFYRMNAAFLDTLSRAYGFSYTVFVQPMGNLSPENPFHKDPSTFAEDIHYRYFVLMLDTLRHEIASGGLRRFVDLTGVDRVCPGQYVDFTHYGPPLCRAIAQAILAQYGVPREGKEGSGGR